jgi:hypothetical protein
MERRTMAQLFLSAILGILWLSGTLLAHDIRAYHAAELRLRRCPKRI